MTGKQVTISSRSATAVRVRRLGRRKTSIQTDVSTRITLPPGRSTGTVATRVSEAALPEPGSGELEDAVRAYAPHEILQRSGDSGGVGTLTAELHRFLQQMLIQHKICTFHTHMMDVRAAPSQGVTARGRRRPRRPPPQRLQPGAGRACPHPSRGCR